MQMNRKVTNGLAWAGAIVVVGVLSADFVTSKFAVTEAAQPTELAVQAATIEPVMPMPASSRPKAVAAAKPDVAPAKPVAVALEPIKQIAAVPTPAKPTAAAITSAAPKSTDVVDNYLADNKALPSYLTDGNTPAATVPVVASVPTQTIATPAISAAGTPVSTTDPVQVGAIGPQKVAPMPLPLSMRPKPQQQPALIIDEATLAPGALPPADVTLQPVPVSQGQDEIVSAQDLQNWESGPLSDFLAKRRGAAPTSSASFDADGFNFGDGPNRRSRAQYITEDDDYNGGGY